jgi:hypothetical protein
MSFSTHLKVFGGSVAVMTTSKPPALWARLTKLNFTFNLWPFNAWLWLEAEKLVMPPTGADIAIAAIVAHSKTMLSTYLDSTCKNLKNFNKHLSVFRF